MNRTYLFTGTLDYCRERLWRSTVPNPTTAAAARAIVPGSGVMGGALYSNILTPSRRANGGTPSGVPMARKERVSEAALAV